MAGKIQGRRAKQSFGAALYSLEQPQTRIFGDGTQRLVILGFVPSKSIPVAEFADGFARSIDAG